MHIHRLNRVFRYRSGACNVRRNYVAINRKLGTRDGKPLENRTFGQVSIVYTYISNYGIRSEREREKAKRAMKVAAAVGPENSSKL